MATNKRNFEHPPVEDSYLVEGINHPLNGIYRDEVSADIGKEVSLLKKQAKRSDTNATINLRIINRD